MAVHQFTLANLSKLDNGKASIAWQHALARAQRDCEDRPEDERARKIILEVELVPLMDGGDLDSINGTFKVREKVPERQTRPYNFGIKRLQNQKVLVFNDMADDDIHQQTIDDLEEGKDKDE